MGKNNKKKEDEPKKSDFKSFLKKRAPIYLGIVAIFVVFVIPELTKGDLEILMAYNGPNEKGLTVLNAIKEQIAKEYPDEKIYDNKKTKVELNITKVDSTENYKVVLMFESYKGKIDYIWNVNQITKEIKAESSNAKHVIDIVNYYD